MKRVTFTARGPRGKRIVTTAYVSAAEDVFAVHRSLESAEDDVWVISHREVGFRIPRLVFPKRKDALHAALEFNRLPGFRQAFFDETRLEAGGISKAAAKRATKLIAFLNEAMI